MTNRKRTPKMSAENINRLKKEVDFEHIRAAVEKYNVDREKYDSIHYRKAKEYEIVDEKGEPYPSKVILAIAFELATGIECKPAELYGGIDPDNGVFTILKTILEGTPYRVISTRKNIDLSDLSSDISVESIEHDIEGIEGSTRPTIIKARVNQGAFRRILLDKYGKCCLCGMDEPDTLIASHIKPWVASDNKEKVNGYNGLLLCPNHDKLFDGGYISFDDEGKIIMDDSLSEKNRQLMNINGDIHIDIPDEMLPFMRYHREHIFKG